MKEYTLIDTNCIHTVIYRIKATDIDDAIEIFCKGQYLGAVKYKNGRWRWGKDYYDSAKELLASNVDLAFEIQENLNYAYEKVEELLCSFDKLEYYYEWNSKEFYMHSKIKIGNCYEWTSSNNSYFILIKSPAIIKRRLRKMFSAI